MRTFLAMIVFALLSAAAQAQVTYEMVIPSGQALTGSVAIGPRSTGLPTGTAISLIMPSAWTAADLLVEASLDGNTWVPVHDSDGARVRIKADAGRLIILDGSVMWGLPYVRFRSVAVGGTSDVVQAAQRTLTLLVR